MGIRKDILPPLIDIFKFFKYIGLNLKVLKSIKSAQARALPETCAGANIVVFRGSQAVFFIFFFSKGMVCQDAVPKPVLEMTGTGSGSGSG